ncbi:MAG TPA: type II secretion system protein [Tepidisphaeraceae bacterium]
MDGKQNKTPRYAFSLVELLVVIGIVAILIAFLVPALAMARSQAKTVACASNMRQLGSALLIYAGENKGSYPPNVGSLYTFWTSTECIGKTIKSQFPSTDNTIAGGVMRCPSDLPQAVRCYSMNIFASGMVSAYVEASLAETPSHGKLWKSNVSNGSHMILLIESFAVEDWPTSDEPTPPPNWKPIGISSPAVVGWVPQRPAERFGYGGSHFETKEIFGAQSAQVCYYRHRTGKSPAGLGEAYGKINIAFADGHVDLYSHDRLVNWSTGKSTYEAMWSPIDREID